MNSLTRPATHALTHSLMFSILNILIGFSIFFCFFLRQRLSLMLTSCSFAVFKSNSAQCQTLLPHNIKVCMYYMFRINNQLLAQIQDTLTPTKFHVHRPSPQEIFRQRLIASALPSPLDLIMQTTKMSLTHFYSFFESNHCSENTQCHD